LRASAIWLGIALAGCKVVPVGPLDHFICVTDSDCAEPLPICQVGICRSACDPTLQTAQYSPCKSNQDCDCSQQCVASAGQCLILCSRNEDCAAYQLCDLSVDACLPADCTGAAGDPCFTAMDRASALAADAGLDAGNGACLPGADPIPDAGGLCEPVTVPSANSGQCSPLGQTTWNSPATAFCPPGDDGVFDPPGWQAYPQVCVQNQGQPPACLVLCDPRSPDPCFQGSTCQSVAAQIGLGDGGISQPTVCVPMQPYACRASDDGGVPILFADAGVYTLSTGAPSAGAVAVADLDRDGYLDVIIGTSQGVEIWYGQDGGGLKASPYLIGPVTALALARLQPGAAVLNVVAAVGNEVIELVGGTLTTPITTPLFDAGAPISALAAGDIEGWGVDVIAVAMAATGHVVLAGIPGASLDVRSPAGILSADFNRDGIADLAVISLSDGGDGARVSFVFGALDGGLQDPAESPYSAPSPSSMATADLNNDGFQDLVVSGDLLSFYYGAPDKLAIGLRATEAGCSASDLVLAPFTRPGFPDLVSVCGGNLELAPRLLSGEFGAPIALSDDGRAAAVASADVDHDGLPDLIVLSTTVADGGGVIQVLRNVCP